MMEAAVLIAFIENPNTLENQREKAISKLNLSGVCNADIEELAYEYWQNYFAEKIEDILKERLAIISHLLPDDVINQCFEDVFAEYQERKKQLGIDDIRKFWAP